MMVEQFFQKSSSLLFILFIHLTANGRPVTNTSKNVSRARTCWNRWVQRKTAKPVAVYCICSWALYQIPRNTRFHHQSDGDQQSSGMSLRRYEECYSMIEKKTVILQLNESILSLFSKSQKNKERVALPTRCQDRFLILFFHHLQNKQHKNAFNTALTQNKCICFHIGKELSSHQH